MWQFYFFPLVYTFRRKKPLIPDTYTKSNILFSNFVVLQMLSRTKLLGLHVRWVRR